MEKREKVYALVSAEVSEFMKTHANGIAILDSTNATFKRRSRLVDIIHSTGAKMMFIEVQNNDAASIDEQVQKIIRGSPDYDGEPFDAALHDFQQKLEKYKQVYETIDSGKYPIESTYNYIKCDLQRGHFIIHNVRGYLQQKIAHFVMNLRTEPHIFYLSRHGQSEYNEAGRIGGDSGLSKHGVIYARKLAEFVEKVITKEPMASPDTAKNTQQAASDSKRTDSATDGEHAAPLQERPARLWTSTMRRTKETAQFIHKSVMSIPDKFNPELIHEWMQMRPRAWHHLDELFAGSCDGMTYEEIEEQFPEEFARRNEDKLAYRYPRGESYLDVIARLEPMIIEMERHREPLLIIGHQGILRIIYAFYMGLSRAESPYVSIPLNTVIECKPGAFVCEVKSHVLYKIPLDDDGQNEPKASHGHSAPAHPICSHLAGTPIPPPITIPAAKCEKDNASHSSESAISPHRTGSSSGSGRYRTNSLPPRTEEEVNNPHSH